MLSMKIRSRILKLLVAIVFLTGVSVGHAQEIRVGGLEGNSAVFLGAVASTVIDWSRPATGNGTVNTASVAWTSATSPCDGIFFVRFYAIPSNALVTVMTAERGPFRAVNGINTVALEPPVAVTSETFIGIRRGAGAESCGMPYGTFTRTPGRALFATTDFKNGSLTGLNPSSNFRLQAQASNVASVRVSTLPVVGSAAGSNNSFFRTSLSLSNPGPIEIRGKLRMRLAGRSGTDSDPTLDYVIPPNGTLNYPDVIAAMSQNGLGSLDILTTASPTPIATARVFSDNGTAGTNGFSEDAVPAGTDYFSVASIAIPSDLTNFRLNIGIRTITAGEVRVSVYDSAGALSASLVKTYSADFFEQVSAAAFLEGNTLPPGGKIVVSAFSDKEFIVYGATTDNRTNDPSMRIGSD